MASFQGVEIFETSIKEWILLPDTLSLNDVMLYMGHFQLNTVQLGVGEDRFLFYDASGDRYGLCDVRTLQTSTGVTMKNIRLHRFQQSDIDQRVQNFIRNNTEFGIDIPNQEKSKIRRRSKKNASSAKDPCTSQTSAVAPDDQEELSSLTFCKFFLLISTLGIRFAIST
jgi:hypothetical protein